MCLRLPTMSLPLHRQNPKQDASIHRDHFRLRPMLCHLLASLPTDHLGPNPQAQVVVLGQSCHRANCRFRLVWMVNHSSWRCRTRL